MNKFLNFFLKTLMLFFLIGFSVWVFYELLKPNPSYRGMSQIFSNKRISEDELFDFLDKEIGNLNNKSFFFSNPMKIKKALMKHPLIDKAKVKHLIFPKRKSEIELIEKEPWAFYKSNLLDSEGNLLTSNMEDAFLYESTKLIFNQKNLLVEIKSVKDLDLSHIPKLRQIILKIENFLPEINPEDLFIIKISIDEDLNVEAISKFLKFKLGLFEEASLKRVDRLKLVINKLKELESEPDLEIDYIDLSLDTADIIIGKKHELQT